MSEIYIADRHVGDIDSKYPIKINILADVVIFYIFYIDIKINDRPINIENININIKYLLHIFYINLY